MKILIPCEFSGIVREAFRKKGHEVWSCDLIPSDDNSEFHLQGDVFDYLSYGWDMMIAFPPCTDLSWANGRYLKEKREDGRTKRALDFVVNIYNSGVKCCIENPRGDLFKWKKPSQIIQPWMFGEPYIKTTCLWLRGLPELVPEVKNKPENLKYWIDVGRARHTRKHGKGINRNSKDRARSFQGIANAMADQWG